MSRAMIAATVCVLALTACDEAMMAETSSIDSGLPSPSQSACMSAVASQAGDGNVTVLSGVSSRARTEYVVGVGEARAPWRCVANDNGEVEEVSSMVDEGML